MPSTISPSQEQRQSCQYPDLAPTLAHHALPCRAERVQLRGPRNELPGEPRADRQDEGREQEAQLLALQALAGNRAELRADDAAGHQDHRQHDIDIVVLGGMQHRGRRGQEDDLEQRGPDHDVGRHAQEVDHGRDHDEAAAHAHDGREQAHE